MNRDEFKRLWDETGDGTADEVNETAREARTNPDMARVLLSMLVQAAQIDPDYRPPMHAMLNACMEEASQRMRTDDAFVLLIAGKVLDTMEMTPPPHRTPRGRVRTAKSA